MGDDAISIRRLFKSFGDRKVLRGIDLDLHKGENLDETGRIISFWQATPDASRLRAMLLTGEAGIGKSRLIEEVCPQIVQAGGAIVHTKLYPESTASIVPLLARALRFLNTRRQLQIGDPGETLSSVMATLRRLARLRPTLLIVEDIHLLAGPTLKEFVLLLDALGDEVLSLLCLTRPVELPARAVLESILVDELELKSLEQPNLAMLWDMLFDTPADITLIQMLHEATLGNPLALRSALHGMLRGGAIAYDASAHLWQATVSQHSLTQMLGRSVELLAEGMTAHLTTEEREAAASLACLGEVFAREAAREMIDNADFIIEGLLFKGIVVTSTTQVAPLPGTASEHPALAFTHTMLHNHLVRHIHADAKQLIRLIASDLPLYSILPFQFLTGCTGTPDLSKEETYRAITRSLDVARVLDGSSDWKLGLEPWKAAENVMRLFASLWSTEEAQLLEAELLSLRLLLLRRSDNHEEYENLVHRLLDLTAEPVPPHLLPHRLKALSFLHALGRRKDHSLCIDTWKEAQLFVEKHPELRFTDNYLIYIDSAARSMLYMGNLETLVEIERQLVGLMHSPQVSDDYRYQAQYIIVCHFLNLFTTEQELQMRLRQLAEMEPQIDNTRRMSFLIAKIDFLCTAGWMEETVETANQALPLFKELNLTNNFFYGSLGRLCALAGLGDPLRTIEAEAIRLAETAPKDIPLFKLFTQMAMVETGLMLDEKEWLREGMERYRNALRHLRPEAQILLALETGMEADALPDVARVASEPFAPLVELFLAGTDMEASTAHNAVTTALQAPLLRLNDLMEKLATFRMVTEIGARLNDPIFAGSLRTDLRNALLRMLAWLADRKMHPYMAPLIERYGSYLTREELRHWRMTMEEIGRERNAESARRLASNERLKVSMLGTIEIIRPGGERVPVRGSRLRALLGLMVADRMLDQPLEHREFSAIVSGTEDDPDKARKMLNGIVFRLRDVVGHDAIITTSETPQINLDLIDIDLLHAQRALREATDAMRERSLLKAQERMLLAIGMTRGEVAFPTLYDNFFEAAREDFENELRSSLLKVAKGLLSEGDPKSAEELLRSGFAAMTEDEEMADLLSMHW